MRNDWITIVLIASSFPNHKHLPFDIVRLSALLASDSVATSSGPIPQRCCAAGTSYSPYSCPEFSSFYVIPKQSASSSRSPKHAFNTDSIVDPSARVSIHRRAISDPASCISSIGSHLSAHPTPLSPLQQIIRTGKSHVSWKFDSCTRSSPTALRVAVCPSPRPRRQFFSRHRPDRSPRQMAFRQKQPVTSKVVDQSTACLHLS